MAILIVLVVCALLAAAGCHEDVCYNKFEYEFSVLQKLVEHEQQITVLMKQLEDAKLTISDQQDRIELLNAYKISSKSQFSLGSSYIRWGRSVCPDNATLVYEGHTAGSNYAHTGAAVNYLCLPKDPERNKYVDGFQSYGRIYGTEWETEFYNEWKNIDVYDAPCALCRTPASDVLMVPGKNSCHHSYVLEYSGYLMTGAYTHAAASEYVCVDGNPEAMAESSANHIGKRLYHVEAECGTLKCPPYVNRRELTCAICSYFPKV